MEQIKKMKQNRENKKRVTTTTMKGEGRKYKGGGRGPEGGEEAGQRVGRVLCVYVCMSVCV